MSAWSHVTGVIRIDGMPPHFEDDSQYYTIPELEKFIGKSWNYDELIKFYRKNGINIECPMKKGKLPYGSEGSVQYTLHQYCKSGLPWVVATFWGDLRDYENCDPIVEWAKNLLQELENANYFIRDFCFSFCDANKSVDLNQNNFVIIVQDA